MVRTSAPPEFPIFTLIELASASDVAMVAIAPVLITWLLPPPASIPLAVAVDVVVPSNWVFPSSVKEMSPDSELEVAVEVIVEKFWIISRLSPVLIAVVVAVAWDADPSSGKAFASAVAPTLRP
jgi:hypothetical protein